MADDSIFDRKTYAKVPDRKDGVTDIKALIEGRDKALVELYEAMMVFYKIRCRRTDRDRNKNKILISDKEFNKIQWAVENARRNLGAYPMLGFEALFALRDEDSDDCFGS